MSGDAHVRFCEQPGGQFPGLTRLSDTVAGAKASANLYSLIQTAKRNELNPYLYLKHVFSELPRAQSVGDVEALLPAACDRDALLRLA